MDKKALLAQLQVIEDMTDTEGVRQICFVLRDLIEHLYDEPMGFQASEAGRKPKK